MSFQKLQTMVDILLLFQQYQQELRSTIGTLMEALNENRSRQDKLKETIDSLEQGRPVKKPSQNAVLIMNYLVG